MDIQPKLVLRWDRGNPESAVFLMTEDGELAFSLELEHDNLAALVETCYKIVRGDDNITPHDSYEEDLLGWVDENITTNGVLAVMKASSIVIFAMQNSEEFEDTTYDFEISHDGTVIMEYTLW